MKLLPPLLLISTLGLSCGGDVQTEDAGLQVTCREQKCRVVWDDDHRLTCSFNVCTCYKYMDIYECGETTIEEALRAGCCR